MSVFWQKVGILFSVMVSWAAVSGITPFFPKIAVDRGMPEWSIGLIYAVCPLTSILTTVSLPRVQERFGRKTILLTGIFFLSISNFIIALVWLSEGFLAILESIFSRITAGIGCGFAVMSANATVTSNFTEDAAKMIALIEIFCGLGLIFGPTFASGLYGLFGYFYSCFVMGCFILVSIPVLFFILGEFRDYVVVEQSEKIGLGSLFFRHKVMIDIIMQFNLALSVGFVTTTIEFHLVNYGVEKVEVGFWYSIFTTCYLLSCLLVSFILENLSKSRVMIFGVNLMSMAFLFLGPCPLIFPESFTLVVIGLSMIGSSSGFLYVPTIPHILESLKYVYKLDIDDRVHDALAGITNISIYLGEIFGMVFSSVLYYEIGFAYSAFVVAVAFAAYGIYYALVSDARKYGVVENVEKILRSNTNEIVPET